MIKAILFDIDGVLLDSFEPNLKFFQDLMEKNGYTPPTREEFVDIFHLNLRAAIKKITGLTDEDKIEEIASMRSNGEVPYHTELSKLPEHAEETIKELSKNYVLGIVTSRIQASVFETPKLATLKDYFKTIACYDDTEKHKPEPEPIFFALKQLDVKPEEVAYVGDVENDLLAARAAGVKFILFPESDLEGVDGKTSDFREIKEIVGSL